MEKFVRTREAAKRDLKNASAPRPHPRTIGWFGITSVAMGGINQSLFLMAALFFGQGAIPGQGSAAVPLLIAGLLLSWAATPGWTELVMMFPNRVGGISATCAEAFKPYSPVLSNLTGVCYWWGWVPTCGLCALLSASALHQWYLPWFPIPLLATCIVLFFTFINLCGVKWAMRFAMPIAVASAGLAFLSAVIPVFSGKVDWHQAFTYHLTVPFPGWFGKFTSMMAGLYLVGFAAPAFEQATSHVGEAINPNKSVPKAIFVSAALASLYFIILPVVWLGMLGPEPLGKDLAIELGPTFAPLLGGAAKAAAVWFMTFNMFHGTLAPLAGAARVLSQLAEDGLLPEFMAKRSRTDAPWVTTLITAGSAIIFLLMGDPVWLIAAANLTYLIGIAMPNIAVWLLRKNHPEMERPYRAPRGTIALGLFAAGAWLITTIFGFQQFGLTTVLAGIGFAYAGSALYAWRKMSDRRKAGLPLIARTLHLKLTGAMLLVLVLDAVGYLMAVHHVPVHNVALIAVLEDIFVVVALLTISVGLILPGMIAHAAVEVSNAADKLVKGTLADFTRAMHALAMGDLAGAKATFNLAPVVVHSRDEVGDMALSFNKLQEEIGRAATGLEGAREGLSKARKDLTEANERLRLAERKFAEEQIERLRNEHAIVLNSVGEGLHWIDLEGRIKFENPASAKMLGYNVTELIGKPAHATMHHTRPNGRPYPQSECGIYATLKDGQVRRVKDEVFWRKDGTCFPVEYTCTPIFDENGHPTGSVVIFSDITERKRVEEQLIQSQKMAAIGQLAGGVAHEINNPLGVILGFAQNLVKHIKPGDSHELSLRSIEREAIRCKNLVRDLLTFSRVSEIKKESMDLKEAVDGALSLVCAHSKIKDVELVQEIAEVPKIFGNKNQIQQVIVNLSNNAIDAMPKGGKLTIRVRKTKREDQEGVEIQVQDTGEGIPVDIRSKIFNPFFTTKEVGKGTGLGLSLVYETVEKHNGNIFLDSEVGKGTIFYVFLPVAA